jgi:hypothetical protein
MGWLRWREAPQHCADGCGWVRLCVAAFAVCRRYSIEVQNVEREGARSTWGGAHCVGAPEQNAEDEPLGIPMYFLLLLLHTHSA